MSVSATLSGPTMKVKLMEQAMFKMGEVIEVNKLRKTHIDALQGQVAALQEQNDALQVKNDAFQEQSDALQEQNAALKTAHANELTALQGQVATLQEQNDALQVKNDEEDSPDQGEKIASLEEKIGELEQEDHNWKQLSSELLLVKEENQRLTGRLQGARDRVIELETKSPGKVTSEEVTPKKFQLGGPPSIWGEVKSNKAPPTIKKSAKDTTDDGPSVEELRSELPTGPSGKSTASDESTSSDRVDVFFPTRECRWGKNCMNRGPGGCTFAHPGETMYRFNNVKTEQCTHYTTPGRVCKYTRKECNWAHGVRDLQPKYVEVGICQPCK